MLNCNNLKRQFNFKQNIANIGPKEKNSSNSLTVHNSKLFITYFNLNKIII